MKVFAIILLSSLAIATVSTAGIRLSNNDIENSIENLPSHHEKYKKHFMKIDEATSTAVPTTVVVSTTAVPTTAAVQTTAAVSTTTDQTTADVSTTAVPTTVAPTTADLTTAAPTTLAPTTTAPTTAPRPPCPGIHSYLINGRLLCLMLGIF